ncbi:hypothetical protein FA95DRAFT_1567229 [Auriscalpium vulgare]|uniref:Uncharacterized protein n=2 Tax=Auriscalpium vulgare TaxID=40419 RepID=A0ACB8R5S6_9AGAM|nr:hypothetical protein FA95DRAFT_1567760 [Auriscalpium vulgare]KAI0039348.1 hypothetical protein FA95DRAFT_1567229 [Auriscalpium vulgare]
MGNELRRAGGSCAGGDYCRADCILGVAAAKGERRCSEDARTKKPVWTLCVSAPERKAKGSRSVIVRGLRVSGYASGKNSLCGAHVSDDLLANCDLLMHGPGHKGRARDRIGQDATRKGPNEEHSRGPRYVDSKSARE